MLYVKEDYLRIHQLYYVIHVHDCVSSNLLHPDHKNPIFRIFCALKRELCSKLFLVTKLYSNSKTQTSLNENE